MDIKHRKTVKKSKILRKPERNTETGVNATKKMDIKPRKTVKSPKTSGSQREIRNRAGENGHKAKKNSKKSKNIRKLERKTEKCR